MVAVDLADLAPLGLRRFTRAEYERLVELGLFEDERVELLHGFLVEMSPQNAAHAYVIQQLARLFTLALADRAIVRTQLPIAAADDSEPEPDLAVVPPGDYRTSHPGEALLVVEVADSSLRKDRNVKVELYASAGVPEHWIVLAEKRTVEIYRDPRDGRYTRLETVGTGATITLLPFPDVTIGTDEFLP